VKQRKVGRQDSRLGVVTTHKGRRRSLEEIKRIEIVENLNSLKFSQMFNGDVLIYITMY